MPRAEAITEVTSADDIADLRWWQQGDKHLETAAVLEERHANRNDPDVRRALSKWWDAALAGDFSATLRHADGEVSIDMHNLEGGQLQRLDKRRYVDILTKIGLALLEEDEESSKDEARQQALRSERKTSRRPTVRRATAVEACYSIETAGAAELGARVVCGLHLPEGAADGPASLPLDPDRAGLALWLRRRRAARAVDCREAGVCRGGAVRPHGRDRVARAAAEARWRAPPLARP